MTTRRAFLGMLAGGFFAAPLAAEAQKAGKVARIGYLATNLAASPHMREAFLQGLRDLGYVEGGNVVIEYRDAEGKLERFPALAAELVALKLDVILAGGTPQTLAAKEATKTIPIVFAAAADAVGSGIITSLARPRRGSRGVESAQEGLPCRATAYLCLSRSIPLRSWIGSATRLPSSPRIWTPPLRAS